MDFISNFGIDLLFIVILVLSVVFSIHKGFMKMLLSFICVILSFVIAGAFNEPIAEWCYESFISDLVVDNVESHLPDVIDDIDYTIESLPDFMIDQAEELDIDIEKTLKKISNKDLSKHKVAEEISDEIICPAVILLLRAVAFIIVFLLARLLLGIIAKLVSNAVKLPVLKQFDKTLGGVLGFFKGLFIVILLAIVFNFVSQVLNDNDVISQPIENSFVCGIIGDIN